MTGPPGAKFKYDLLSNSQPGIIYQARHIGAFEAKNKPPGSNGNNEMQWYTDSAVTQDPGTGEVTIKAERHRDGRITSARLESYGMWTTAQSSDIKMRGYVEVEATLPAKVGHHNFAGSWPAIWLLGPKSRRWPHNAEIDIVEVSDGKPKIIMTTHSTNRNMGNGQHPSKSPYRANADFTIDPLIAGLEWNVQPDKGQIDLTWWMSWRDVSTKQWVKSHTTKSLFKNRNNDYEDFYTTFKNEGFALILNLAQGGAFPRDAKHLY